jgi:hypothetical protein
MTALTKQQAEKAAIMAKNHAKKSCGDFEHSSSVCGNDTVTPHHVCLVKSFKLESQMLPMQCLQSKYKIGILDCNRLTVHT